MSLLQDRIICITGASRGIGRGCALECAKQGARGIVLHYLGDEETEAEVNVLASEISATYETQVLTVPGDIGLHNTSIKIVKEGVKAFGRIDVLVSNAGICPFSDFLTMDIETWHRTRNVNLDGAFYITQAVARQMQNQVPQGGRSVSALNWIHVPLPNDVKHHRNIFNFCTGGRGEAGPLHTNQGWHSIPYAIDCCCPGQVQYSSKCDSTWNHPHRYQQGGPFESGEAYRNGEQNLPWKTRTTR